MTDRDEAKGMAAEAGAAARDMGARTVRSAQERAAEEVSGFAHALRTAADEMREGSPQERTLAQIADGFADASDAIRDNDLGQMIGAASDVARRNPALFLGGAAFLGFVAARFAKASAHEHHGSGYGSHGGAGWPENDLASGSDFYGDEPVDEPLGRQSPRPESRSYGAV